MNEFFEIDIEPTPWAAPKRNGRFTFSPKKQSEYREDLRKILKGLFKGEPTLYPIELDVTFYMPMPKSWSKKKRDETLGDPHCCTPDASNLLKMLEDCMQGILFENDKQIWNTHCAKVWSDTPHIEVHVLGNENYDKAI